MRAKQRASGKMEKPLYGVSLTVTSLQTWVLSAETEHVQTAWEPEGGGPRLGNVRGCGSGKGTRDMGLSDWAGGRQMKTQGRVFQANG